MVKLPRQKFESPFRNYSPVIPDGRRERRSKFGQSLGPAISRMLPCRPPSRHLYIEPVLCGLLKRLAVPDRLHRPGWAILSKRLNLAVCLGSGWAGFLQWPCGASPAIPQWLIDRPGRRPTPR